MPIFPGAKTVCFGPIFKNIGGTITKAKVMIPGSRLSGEITAIFMKTSLDVDWEEVNNFEEYTFTNSGNEIYLMIVASGAVISGRKDGKIIPGILVKVLEVL